LLDATPEQGDFQVLRCVFMVGIKAHCSSQISRG
jgi:hypothetical protein